MIFYFFFHQTKIQTFGSLLKGGRFYRPNGAKHTQKYIMFLTLLSLVFIRIRVPVGESSNIPYLIGENITKEIQKHHFSIVFFADSYTFIDFSDFAISEYKKQITFIRSDLSDGFKYKCKTSPCIVPFKKGKVIYTEPAPTSPAQFLLWTKNVLTPGSVNVSSTAHLKKLLMGHKPIVFGVDEKKRPEKLKFTETLYKVDSSLFKMLEIPLKKGYYMFRPADHEIVPFDRETDQLLAATTIHDITDVKIDAKPFLAGYMLPMDSDDSCESEMKILKSISEKYSDKIQFTTLYGKEAEKYKKASDLMTLPPPYFFIFNTSDLEGGRWLIYKKPSVTDEQYIDGFVKRVINNEEYFTVISEEIPTYGNEAFKRIVADNFDEMVIDNDNEVLVAFTAPWCPHCANLKPVLNETAELLRDTPIKIYYMDGAANDIPECVPGIEGYPTLFFWPSGKKEEDPIKYNGFRRFNDILRFVTNSSTRSIEIPEYNTTEIQDRIKEALKTPAPPEPEYASFDDDDDDDDDEYIDNN